MRAFRILLISFVIFIVISCQSEDVTIDKYEGKSVRVKQLPRGHVRRVPWNEVSDEKDGKLSSGIMQSGIPKIDDSSLNGIVLMIMSNYEKDRAKSKNMLIISAMLTELSNQKPTFFLFDGNRSEMLKIKFTHDEHGGLMIDGDRFQELVKKMLKHKRMVVGVYHRKMDKYIELEYVLYELADYIETY